MDSNETQCNYGRCSSIAYRHFFGKHYCNEHNWLLRVKAKVVKPSSLERYLEKHG